VFERSESLKKTVAANNGSAAAWPLAADAQQGGRMRRIGALMNLSVDDPESLSRVTAFVQGLQELGWTDGRNVRIDFRWGAGDAEHLQKYAVELVSLAPDITLASGDGAAVSLQRATRTLPIVFVNVGEPISNGLVESLARPGGNATGLMNFEYSLSTKWLELLKQIAPHLTRVGVLRDIEYAGNIGQLGAIQAAAPSVGVDSVIDTTASEALP
jgi:putative tryptophan/tyrosine transport system substrate-binding protein